MLNQDVHELILKLVILYSVVGFFLAFTVAAILSLFRVVVMPPKAQTYFYGTYLAAVVGLCLAYATDVFKPPASAASEVAAHVQSGQAHQMRSASVVYKPDAGGETTGLVYIQIPDGDRRPAARALQRALLDSGLRSPGVEIIDPKFTPGTPEVRYFNDEDRPLAEKVAEIARDNNLAVPPEMVKRVTDFSAPLGQIELWFARPKTST